MNKEFAIPPDERRDHFIFHDVTDEREPEIPSYETDGPYDYTSPLEEM